MTDANKLAAMRAALAFDLIPASWRLTPVVAPARRWGMRFFCFRPPVFVKARAILKELRSINQRLTDVQEDIMAVQESFDALKAEVAALTAEVADTNSKIDAAIVLIEQLKNQPGPITAEQLDALTSELKGDEDTLSAKSDSIPQS